MNIQPVTPTDLPTVLHLNQSAMPRVNSLSPEKLAGLAEMAARFSAATIDARLAGFVLALPHTANYDSPYFGWFGQHYRQFIYVDRIVVADWARRRGIGLALLADVAAVAFERGLSLASDLYAENETSLAFHLKFGFEPVGRQTINSKTVLKLMKLPPK